MQCALGASHSCLFGGGFGLYKKGIEYQELGKDESKRGIGKKTQQNQIKQTENGV